MALKTFVKVSGVNNLSDARYCAGMGVDILGFNLNPGDENHIPKQKFDEIREWVSGVKISGEFDTAEPSAIREVLENIQIDYIEYSRPELSRELSTLGKPLILRINVSDMDTAEISSAMNFAGDLCDFFVLESGNDDIAHDQILHISTLARDYPLILAFGINADNVISLLDQLPLKGIALYGGHEIKPGLKDYEELAEILEILEVDDYA